MVTRSGENILERYDDFAVREFRRLKLVWSGWDGDKLTEEDGIGTPFDLRPPFDGWRLRKVTSEYPERIRLFALSLLWRAAASQMRAVADVNLDADQLEELRKMVSIGNPEPLSLFPVTFIQFMDKGAQHNQSPTKETKTFPGVDAEQEVASTFFRFYFDGLLIHVHEEMPPKNRVSFGKMEIGAAKEFTVLARPFEGSAQSERLARLMMDAEANHAHVLERILGQRSG